MRFHRKQTHNKEKSMFNEQRKGIRGAADELSFVSPHL